MDQCEVCTSPAKYHLEWREPGEEVKRTRVCAEHSQFVWNSGLFARAKYFFQQVLDRDLSQYPGARG